ncbi:hypothetical protein DPMN_038489 [Dreissena polymorpha]|uniref:Mab-21-like HhH/H2TH-like domain-containing protein n=2 Tax=Dreissena polymorpha TaxID=45954 RepID=A0A9D4MFD2_DREPO|nr:hypothetical protein DPMN_038489 [Dreissena polymorpha]
MNCLGYGLEIRQARRNAYRERDRLLNERTRRTILITTGSNAEGLTGIFESDIDQMHEIKGIMCLEEGVNSDILPNGTIVFPLNSDLCYHGHCKLYLLERLGSIISKKLRDFMCDDENGHVLLSSALFFDFYDHMENNVPGQVLYERAGPSKPSSFGPMHRDTVPSLRCHCPGILLRWAERSRHWPPPDIVQKVVTMGAFVVPVGFKGSEYQHFEWRICFNAGENELVSNLNNTQVYIYVILKMVVKDVLKPVKKEITSYTVKNIVFWLAENNQQARFGESSLFYWLREGLKQLRTAILMIHLPYYMIPERNIMAACGLDEEQKNTFVKTITDMMNEGQKILLRLPKLRMAIIAHPEPLMWYSKKRVELELVNLQYTNRSMQCLFNNGVVNTSFLWDPISQALEKRQIEIVEEVVQRMNLEGSWFLDLAEIGITMMK